jgi:hypothetical protein
LAFSSQCRSLEAVQGHLKENVGHFEVGWGDLFTFLGVTSKSAQNTELTDFTWPHPLNLIGCFFQMLVTEGC